MLLVVGPGGLVEFLHAAHFRLSSLRVCFYSERFLVTVHREACPAFAEIRKRYQQRENAIEQPSLLLYRVIDGLVDSFFPSLAAFDDRIDELEDGIFRTPTTASSKRSSR